MSNVLKSIKLDYYTLKPIFKTLAFTYVLAVFLAVFTQPTIVIVIVMIFSVVFSGMVFSINEKNHLSKLYGILPLRRSDAVLGRYLYALLFGIMSEILAVLLAYVVSLIVNKSISLLDFSFYISLFFLYFCLSIGISFPIYYKFGFTKSYIFTFLPLYAVALSGILISKKADKSNIKQIIQYFMNNPSMLWVAGIGLGLILLVTSCAFSGALFNKKEL